MKDMTTVRTIILLATASLTLACGHTSDETVKSTTPPADKKPANPVFAEIVDDPSLPRVLLIGDSISVGYTLPTRDLLRGKANVHRIPINGGPTTRGLEQLDEWLGAEKWDVIHFNWGLHDLKFMEDGKRQVPLPQYRANLRKLVQRMKSTGAVLIWASTTPVPEGDVSPKRIPADVAAYNGAAQRIMRLARVRINDLYAFALPKLSDIQRPVNVHFTPDGSAALARQVATSIEKAMN